MKTLAALPLCLGLVSLASGQEATLKEVVVTSTADDVSERRQAATQKVIVTRQDIENMGALTVSDVMSKLPGIDAGTPGADGSMALRTRGMARDSVQIYIDGERVAGNSRMAQAMVGRLPSTELERVEIVRGASAEFGGNAPVTVNLVFKKARSKESTALKLALGARNDEPNVQFSLTKGGGDKTFSWLVPVTLNFHRMPSDRNLVRTDSTGTNQVENDESMLRVREMVLSPRLAWKSGSDSFSLMPSVFRAFGHRVGDSVRSDFTVPAAGTTRYDDEESRTAFNRLRAEGEMVRDGIKYSARFAGSDGERNAKVSRTSIASGSTTLSFEESRRDELDLNGAFRIDWAKGPHVLAAALEASGHNRDDSQEHNGTFSSTETHSGKDQTWTMWLQDEWGIDKGVTLTAGLRSEFIRYEIDSNSRRYNRASPSIALRWEPAELWLFRTSLGSAIKPPRLDELSSQPSYSIGTNTPTEPDRRGNPELRAERSLNYEAVLERYLPGEAGVFGGNLYLRRTQDFIERRISLEGSRWVERPWNEGEATHWGVEFDAKLRTDMLGWPGATVRVHLTLPRSRVHDERLGVTRAARDTPRYLLSTGLDQTLASGMSLGTSIQYSGKVLSQVPGEQHYETRPRTILDVYALKRLNSEVNLRLSMQNLLKAKIRRQSEFTAGADRWSTEATEVGTRTVLLALEGKW